MWRACGVRRDAGRLPKPPEDIDRWCSYVLPRQFTDPEGWELQNMLAVARLMIARRWSGKKPAACTCGPIFRTSTTPMAAAHRVSKRPAGSRWYPSNSFKSLTRLFAEKPLRPWHQVANNGQPKS